MAASLTLLAEFLDSQGIRYQRFDHPAVFTCEEARQHVPSLPAAETKNLFLRDGKGKRHFLVTVSPDKNVDLKALSKALEISGLGFASPERLSKYLGLDPGSVTLLGVFNDPEKVVEVIIDREIWEAAALQCHPLVNTSTFVLSRSDLEKFLKATDYRPQITDVPSKSGAE